MAEGLTLRGQNYKLSISRAGTGVGSATVPTSPTNISGDRISMRTINVSRTRDSRTAPGGGQLGKFYMTAFTLEVDSTDAHDDLFDTAGGARLYCTATPDGGREGATLGPVSFQAVCAQSSSTAVQADDSCRWAVNFTVDGDFDPFA